MLKVFHAGGQDIEIIYNLTGKTPHPLFDTQIAAMALGQGEQIGYSNLVQRGSASRSTRARASPTGRGARSTSGRSTMRSATSPTSPRCSPRCSQAAQDRARRLARRGDGAGRRSRELRQRPRDGVEARPDHEPQARRARPAEGARAWREREAKSKNLPRGRIVKDETLADIAPARRASRPISPSARPVGGMGGERYRPRLMAALDAAEPMTDDEMPPREDRAPACRARARWSPTCSSCCSRSAPRRRTSRPSCSRAARSSRRSPAACATG